MKPALWTFLCCCCVAALGIASNVITGLKLHRQAQAGGEIGKMTTCEMHAWSWRDTASDPMPRESYQIVVGIPFVLYLSQEHSVAPDLGDDGQSAHGTCFGWSTMLWSSW